MSEITVRHCAKTVNRTCRICRQVKTIEEFPVYSAKGIKGHRHACRVCWNKKWTPVVVRHGNRYYHENVGGYRDRAKARTAERHKKDRVGHVQRNRAYADRHPLKHAAKVSVMIAVRSGRLARKPCEVCGEFPSQAHHDDYSKPLDVLWLCTVHHGERHRLLNRKVAADQWPSHWPEALRVREFPELPRRELDALAATEGGANGD